MSVNGHEIPILVIYYTKSRILCQQEFGSFSNFGKLLSFFNDNIKNDDVQLKKKYLLNNIEIKNSDLLIDLIQPYNRSKKIINASFSIEIEEINNIGDENIPCFKKILQPNRFNFGLYVFIPEKGMISLEEYPDNIIKKFEFEKFNMCSAYCNSPKSLYVSGGKYNNEKINNFWIIDNEFYSIRTINMPFSKSNHSMIYIKNKEKEIIFVAGGDDIKTFYFDIKNNNFVTWGDMNGIHFLPGLIIIGDYLYSFHLIKDDNNKIFFEKTNINNKKHIWEKIYPNFESKEIINNIINNEFGTSHCAGEKIMLIGGSFNNPNSYLYDINRNSFSFNDKCKNKFIPLIDKTFYKINKNHNIALPASLYKHIEISILNKLKYTLRKINLNPLDLNKTIKYKIMPNQDSIIGKVLVEFNTEESQDFDNKNKNIKNNSYPIDINASDNIYEEKIIPTMPKEKPLIFQQKENQKNNLNNNKCGQNINQNNKNILNQINIIHISNNNKNEIQNNLKQKSNISNKKNNIKNNIIEKDIDDNIIDNGDDDFEDEQKDKIINQNNNIDNNIDNNNEQINFDIDIEKIESIKDNNYSETNNVEQDNYIHINNDNNIVSDENEKNADYMIIDKSDEENIKKGIYMNNPDEEIEEIPEENNENNGQNNINSDENNNYENNENENNENDGNDGYEKDENEFEEINEEDMDEFNDGQNYYDENENGNENEDGEGNGEEGMNGEEENGDEYEEHLKRDRFESTIVQNLSEDIIQIENYQDFYFDENNFGDYNFKLEEKL